MEQLYYWSELLGGLLVWCIEPEQEACKLEHLLVDHEAEVPVDWRVHMHMKVCITSIYWDYPLVMTDGSLNWLPVFCIHLKMQEQTNQSLDKDPIFSLVQETANCKSLWLGVCGLALWCFFQKLVDCHLEVLFLVPRGNAMDALVREGRVSHSNRMPEWQTEGLPWLSVS